MITTDSIRSVQDLRGKQIAVDSKNSHAGLNIWLFMRQEGLDLDKGDYELVETHASTDKRWKGVLAGEFDAAFVDLPHNLRAKKRRSAGDHGAADAHDLRRDADRRNVL